MPWWLFSCSSYFPFPKDVFWNTGKLNQLQNIKVTFMKKLVLFPGDWLPRDRHWCTRQTLQRNHFCNRKIWNHLNMDNRSIARLSERLHIFWCFYWAQARWWSEFVCKLWFTTIYLRFKTSKNHDSLFELCNINPKELICKIAASSLVKILV